MKVSRILLVLCMFFVILAPSAAAAEMPINVFINGQKLSFDVEPITVEGRLMLPVRAVFTAFGVPQENIIWDEKTQSVTAVYDGRVIYFTIGSTIFVVNGASRVMDVPPKVINGRAMLPVRFVAQALGTEDVTWDQQTQSVYINRPLDKTITDTINYKDGIKYIGEIKNGLPNGNGKLYYSNGNLSFEGYFIDGLLNGTGKQFYQNGTLSYDGEWKDGKSNGNGKAYDPNGNLISDGVFKDNVLVSGKAYLYKDGHLVWSGEGTFNEGQFTGYGAIYDQGGKITTIAKFDGGKIVNQVNNAPSMPAIPTIPLPIPQYSPPVPIVVPILPSPTGVIESQIDGDFEGWDGDTIFKLTNGQIWQQSLYSYTYHYAYRPNVIIYPTSGGYKMKVDGVSSEIYVKRLK